MKEWKCKPMTDWEKELKEDQESIARGFREMSRQVSEIHRNREKVMKNIEEGKEYGE